MNSFKVLKWNLDDLTFHSQSLFFTVKKFTYNDSLLDNESVVHSIMGVTYNSSWFDRNRVTIQLRSNQSKYFVVAILLKKIKLL